uniref:Cytochrome P450 n=1 Tax=Catagonus wagneri TaxID=51154 RepID=A0A8C3W6V3_9CETA
MESSWLETHWARPFHLALVFCLALGLLQAVKLYLQRQRLLRDLRPFPSPPAHWFHGHQKIIQNGGMEKLREIIDKYPCGFPFWHGPFQAFFYIYDADYAKTFLSRTDPKSKFLYKFLDPLIGKGLLNLNGPKWFQHRCLLSPVFHFNTLRSHVEIMAYSVNTMLGKWERICGTEDTLLEISEHITLMTLDILMKCIFSWETNCQVNSTHDHYIKVANEGSNIIFHRVYNFLYHHDIIFKFSPKGHRLREISKILHHYTEKIIQDGKNCHMNENKQDNTQKRKYQNVLDIALSAQNRNSLSDTDLRAEADMFMVAGSNSRASGISWVLYALASHPEHQQRCREEKWALFQGPSGPMPYTTMCIKEALRLYPPLPGISRKFREPTTLPAGMKLTTPTNLSICKNTWELRHPHVLFDPSRNCIRKQLAMNKMKVAVALTLLHFELAPDPSRVPIPIQGIVLKPKNGIQEKLP